MTIAEELRRQKQIEEIESGNFVQENFRSDMVRHKDAGEDEDEEFKFGTSNEVLGRKDAKSKMDQLASEGLLNPQLFANQEEREKRYLSHLFELRQNHLEARRSN